MSNDSGRNRVPFCGPPIKITAFSIPVVLWGVGDAVISALSTSWQLYHCLGSVGIAGVLSLT